MYLFGGLSQQLFVRAVGAASPNQGHRLTISRFVMSSIRQPSVGEDYWHAPRAIVYFVCTSTVCVTSSHAITSLGDSRICWVGYMLGIGYIYPLGVPGYPDTCPSMTQTIKLATRVPQRSIHVCMYVPIFVCWWFVVVPFRFWGV